jgi:uncharacterized Fe-S center protein
MTGEAILLTDEKTLIEFLEKEIARIFSSGDRIAVKIHMGEPGNTTHVPASLSAQIVGALNRIECRPFIFDTPVVYRSPRSSVESYLKSAAGHGYTESHIGAPIVISDRSTPIKGKLMTYNVAQDVLDADGVLLLTHFKGHMASGMGGAIKNIGMGCMSKETKGAIHTGGEPVYDEGCTECGNCVENCPTKNIRLEDGQPWFDCTWCPGCSNCAIICPENCISPKVALFDEAIAEAAVIAHDRFKKVYAINVLRNITKLCDCIANSGPVIADDIGFVCAGDMLTADIASLDIIKERTGKEDIFFEFNMRSSWGHVRAAADMMKRTTDISWRGAE